MSLPTFDQLYYQSNTGSFQPSFDYAPTVNSHISASQEGFSIPLYIMQIELWQQVAMFSVVLALPFVVIMIYSYIRTRIIWAKEWQKMHNQPLSLYGALLYGEAKGKIDEDAIQTQLDTLKEMAESDDEQTRKMAIIEADVVLDEVLTKLGHEKGSVGEKIKKVSSVVFPEIELAWEAHKVRNKIAHEKDFSVNKELAKSTIAKYTQFIKAALK